MISSSNNMTLRHGRRPLQLDSQFARSSRLRLLPRVVFALLRSCVCLSVYLYGVTLVHYREVLMASGVDPDARSFLQCRLRYASIPTSLQKFVYTFFRGFLHLHLPPLTVTYCSVLNSLSCPIDHSLLTAHLFIPTLAAPFLPIS
jgi:hypothetical protein